MQKKYRIDEKMGYACIKNQIIPGKKILLIVFFVNEIKALQFTLLNL
jgi:hypothetical protein